MRRSSKSIAAAKGSASLFAALGDKTRLRLVSHLCDDGPMSITRLTPGYSITRQAIAKHLRVMEEAGLVRSTRHGRENIWRLDQQPLEDARRYLELISKQWDDALGRLGKFVESGRMKPVRNDLRGKRARVTGSSSGGERRIGAHLPLAPDRIGGKRD